MKGKIIFEETQRFRYTWSYWLIVFSTVPLCIGAFFGFFQQLVLNVPFGDKPMNDTGLLIVGILLLLFTVGLIWLFHVMTLRVSIDHSSIYYSFFPFIIKEKAIRADDVTEIEVKKYDPIWDYGGWGYRWRPGAGRALNVKGNRGLWMLKSDGKKLLIGTQQPEKLKIALDQLKENWRGKHG